MNRNIKIQQKEQYYKQRFYKLRKNADSTLCYNSKLELTSPFD